MQNSTPIGMSDRDRINAAFAQIAAIIRKEKHNDASIFRMISTMIVPNPSFAFSFSSNVSEILDSITTEVDYTEIVVEAYRRSLFRPNRAGINGSFFCDDPDAAEEFARAIVAMNNGMTDMGDLARFTAGRVH